MKNTILLEIHPYNEELVYIMEELPCGESNCLGQANLQSGTVDLGPLNIETLNTVCNLLNGQFEHDFRTQEDSNLGSCY